MGFNWFALGNEPDRTFEFRCECCGEIHRGSPSFAYKRPFAYFLVPEGERETRIEIGSDTCAIDGEAFYIRTILEIPIDGADEPFTWGLWVSQSEDSFERYRATYDDDQSGDGSFGWLTVTMPLYDRVGPRRDLEQIPCDVNWAPPGERPVLVPHESDHSIYHDFTSGISWERAIELARAMMHPDD
jgi:hypothetical protein